MLQMHLRYLRAHPRFRNDAQGYPTHAGGLTCIGPDTVATAQRREKIVIDMVWVALHRT